MNQEQESLEGLTAAVLVESGLVDPSFSIIGLKIGPFNAALFRKREELGLTQGELAKRVGFKTPASIGQFETLRAFPRPEIAQKIADALSVSRDDLFPEWLRLFTRDKKQPAQVRVELTESEVSRALLHRAYQTEALTARDPYQDAEDNILKETVKEVLLRLPSRERRVLELTRGLIDGRSYTYDEVAGEFKVTPGRIRQIEAKALRKLRHPSRSKHLVDFVDQQQGNSRTNRALVNGAINAIHQGNLQRAGKNLAEVEKNLKSSLSLFDKEVELVEALFSYNGADGWEKESVDQFILWYMKEQNLDSEMFRHAEIKDIIQQLQEVRKLRAQIPNQSATQE